MFELFRFLPFAALAIALTSCSSGADDVTRIAFIGEASDLKYRGTHLAPAGQHIRLAVAEGLVGLDKAGEVVPAVAQRWIVTDDGLSYVFRLRNAHGSGGTALTSENVRTALETRIERLEGTSLGLDLEIISDIRAMTGAVIEIRLTSPMPQFLQLLAQPELALVWNNDGLGPMAAAQAEDAVLLSVLPPEQRGAPPESEWDSKFRHIEVASVPAQQAAALFEGGELDLVLNGDLLSLPVANLGPLSSGTLRLDGVTGLFGLRLNHSNGLLDEQPLREALAMGVDRETLLQQFNLGGWLPSTRIVPADIANAGTQRAERWSDMSFEARRAEAKRRIVAWRAENLVAEAILTITMPDAPGSDTLFAELASDFDDIGVTLERAKQGDTPDLTLVDTLARYADSRWFLNQFNCSLERGMCSPEADALVLDAMSTRDPAATAQLLAEAEQEMLSAQIFIPIGAPVRWSLIRGGVDGFAENSWGLHPLFPMAWRPI